MSAGVSRSLDALMQVIKRELSLPQRPEGTAQCLEGLACRVWEHDDNSTWLATITDPPEDEGAHVKRASSGEVYLVPWGRMILGSDYPQICHTSSAPANGADCYVAQSNNFYPITIIGDHTVQFEVRFRNSKTAVIVYSDSIIMKETQTLPDIGMNCDVWYEAELHPAIIIARIATYLKIQYHDGTSAIVNADRVIMDDPFRAAIKRNYVTKDACGILTDAPANALTPESDPSDGVHQVCYTCVLIAPSGIKYNISALQGGSHVRVMTDGGDRFASFIRIMDGDNEAPIQVEWVDGTQSVGRVPIASIRSQHVRVAPSQEALNGIPMLNSTARTMGD